MSETGAETDSRIAVRPRARGLQYLEEDMSKTETETKNTETVR